MGWWIRCWARPPLLQGPLLINCLLECSLAKGSKEQRVISSVLFIVV